jgi:hypothetical protein
VFTDRASGFSTPDVRDVQEHVLQFSNANELIWTADGTRLPGYRAGWYDYGDTREYSIEGKICPQGCSFVVRFGTKDGERRAYLTVDYTHDNPGTLVDVEVAGGNLVVTQTSVFPPGSPTLSGTVTEMTPTGPAPLGGVTVYRNATSGWREGTTDKDGFYQIPGLFDGTAVIDVTKEGYQRETRNVTISGDTRFDMQLVRR